jgi:hypothetical protein
MKIRSVGPELFHADGKTHKHTTMIIAAFRNFAKAHKQKKKTLVSEKFYGARTPSSQICFKWHLRKSKKKKASTRETSF